MKQKKTMVVGNAIRRYIAFRRWIAEVCVDAGLTTSNEASNKANNNASDGCLRTQPRTASKPPARKEQHDPTTELRISALEREIAELRAATAALQKSPTNNSTGAPGQSPPKTFAIPPRTMPRPHPTQRQNDEHRAARECLSQTPQSEVKPPGSKHVVRGSQRDLASSGAPLRTKPVSELTRDEVAISLLSRFATSPLPSSPPKTRTAVG